MKHCKSCGAQVEDDSLFCTNCGKPILQNSICPHCGAIINDGDVFCTNCGKVVGDNDCKAMVDAPMDANEDTSLILEEEDKPRKRYIYYILGGLFFIIIFGAILTNYYSSVQRHDRERAVADSLEIVQRDSLRRVMQRGKEMQDSIDAVRRTQKDVIDIYVRLINDFKKNDNGNWSGCYFLKDITGDDIPELWVEANTATEPNGIDFTLYVYTVIKGNQISLYEGYSGHPYHHSYHEGDNYVLRFYAHQGAVSWTKFEYIYSVVKEKRIFSQELNEEDEEIRRPSEPEIKTNKLSDSNPILCMFGNQIESSEAVGSSEVAKASEEKHTSQNDISWLQGHWVYEQGSYKGHLVIQGNTIAQYSSMNPEPYKSVYRIDGNTLRARIIDGMDLEIKIDYANKRIDFGNGLWMHKVSSGSTQQYSSPSVSSNTQQRQRPFSSAQDVLFRIYNQRFIHSSGLEIRIDGYGRIEIGGDAAGVISVLHYNSESALLRYGNGMYGEGKIMLMIDGNKLLLQDPVDGSVFYQR